MAKLSVIIPAAGVGTRIGSDIPKPFLKIGGKTILEHTITNFLQVSELIQLIVATSKEYFPDIQSITEELVSPAVSVALVEGAEERQYSIYNALQKVSDDAELVAVHDAVRPFVKVSQIEECCKTAADYGGAVLGVPAKDTIKKIQANHVIDSTPDRSRLWQAQTPQVFQKDLLLKAYAKALKDNFTGTDDSSLVERIGGQVKMVEGARENLKITYPIDLKIAELILQSKK